MSDDRSEDDPSRDAANDGDVKLWDPRRFTPTLHANLVSEILTLRRDQEEKTKQIESLESSLHANIQDQERLLDSLSCATKETRSLKRQLSLLEGGSSSALSELSRERDEAAESIVEVKKRLDAAQKKIRRQEDDSQKVHDLWAQDKTNWEDERRCFERKMHIAETRLKTLLDEVAAHQAAQTHAASSWAGHAHDSDGDDSVQEFDTASVRKMSITNSTRQSLLGSPGPGLNHGNCLADELGFDDDQIDADGRESALSSYASPKNGRVHWRNHSLESLKRPGSVARGKPFMDQVVYEAPEDDAEEDIRPVLSGPTYTNAAVQYSPPPVLETRLFEPIAPEVVARRRTIELDIPRGEFEIEANQSRKRVQVGRPLKMEHFTVDLKMVSVAAQTSEEPLSPPKTPKTPCRDLTPPPVAHLSPVADSSTQTDTLSHDCGKHMSPPMPRSIPIISVQPPPSRPTTPQSLRLPQYSKDFGCQVNLRASTSTTDAVVQTEGIQTDKRLAQLPVHLHPSTITSRPTSPNASTHDKSFNSAPDEPPARNPKRLTQGGEGPEIPSSSMISHCEEDDLCEPCPELDDEGPPLSSRGGNINKTITEAE